MPRVAVQYRTTSKEVYKKFCDSHPSINISFEKWKEIIYTFNYGFRDHLLETGDKGKLPWGMGSFSISKRKAKKLYSYKGKEYINMPVDWVKSKKLGKKVYMFNPHTDGYRYKWIWFKKEARIKYIDIWIFKPSRVTSRKLADYLKRPNSPYAQLYKEWERKYS